MVKCNIERIKDVTSDFIAISDADTSTQCEQNLSNADMLDFRSEMDNRSFYEKTAWNACEDLIYTIIYKLYIIFYSIYLLLSSMSASLTSNLL